jgi:two-component system OmpR family sensor kinase
MLRRLSTVILRHRRPSVELLLLRSICHELRPPVSVLGSLMRTLGDEPIGRDTANRAEITQLACEHAMHLESVLRQAAAMTHGLSPAPSAGRRMPLHRILPATVAVVPPARLTVQVSPAAGEFVVDGQHTRQVLTNLLENAVRHGPEHGAVLLRADTVGRRLRLAVSDEGELTQGLRVSLRRRRPPVDTTGLGLWIVRQLVTRGGGSIRALSSRTGGVTVEVVLPPSGGAHHTHCSP